MAATRDGQVLVQAWIPADAAEAFRNQARAGDGGTSQALRRMIIEAVSGRPAPPPRGVGTGHQIGVRLKPAERLALAEAARERGMTPANWLRSLALAHLSGRPQWSDDELEAMRELFRELRRIGTNINQLAQAANMAAKKGEGIEHLVAAGEATKAAGEINVQMQRLGEVVAGNASYWGGKRR
jgi:uncharacterized protein YukE